jgi:hypothetical protein
LNFILAYFVLFDWGSQRNELHGKDFHLFERNDSWNGGYKRKRHEYRRKVFIPLSGNAAAHIEHLTRRFESVLESYSHIRKYGNFRRKSPQHVPMGIALGFGEISTCL